jgi:exonuclease SbcD
MDASPVIAPPAARPHPSRFGHAVRLIHTSDVHVGGGYKSAHDGNWPETALALLSRMVSLSAAEQADMVLIVGDFFDHNRINADLAAMTGELLGQFRVPVVILPGNHDPYLHDGVYARHRAAFPANVHILSRQEGELLVLDRPGVQVWGQAHASYDNFGPTAQAPAWHDDSEKPLWRIGAAHGYYAGMAHAPHLSYQMHDHELVALQAHYVGLGHLEHHEPVGPPEAMAWYPGALDRTKGATLVDLAPDGVAVRHVKLSE